MVLGPLEVLVHAVRGASPNRLDQFVSSRFRDADPVNLFSARLELLCAANLAIRHVPFEFGGTAEPDLTWDPGTGAKGWLEIHRGAFSVFDNLQQALDKELADKGAILTVRLVSGRSTSGIATCCTPASRRPSMRPWRSAPARSSRCRSLAMAPPASSSPGDSRSSRRRSPCSRKANP
jgi:hypothetical protein